ncbi:alpha/beta hydrolase [Herbiconiux ginsengi]|uniref:alpha/beta hydrolase n=1 Tax=Herbiconiux ginsengi TaxID=381665 RepID=UPI001587A491
MYPLLHAQSPEYGPELRASLARLAPAFHFTPELVAQLARQYAGEAHLDDPVAFPGNANSAFPCQLPSTFVLNADEDELHASGEEFGRQLRNAGVHVDMGAQPHMYHGCLDDTSLPAAHSAIATMANWLTDALRAATLP